MILNQPRCAHQRHLVLGSNVQTGNLKASVMLLLFKAASCDSVFKLTGTSSVLELIIIIAKKF